MPALIPLKAPLPLETPVPLCAESHRRRVGFSYSRRVSDPVKDDPFRRVDYRRMIAWPGRIEREAPFLLEVLAAAPEGSVLDLGCGTGEHTDFLAAQGYRAVGIDHSEAQIGKAREYEGRRGEAGPQYVEGDFTQLADHVKERFAAAICLGNCLPYLEEDELERTLTGLARQLVPGGRLVFQILNYERILSVPVRHLPLNFRDHPDESGEIVFLRLMTPDGDKHVRFNVVTLALEPGDEPPVELRVAREVRVRAWTRPELERMLAAAGFAVVEVYGDMTRGGYDAQSSADLVMVAESR